MIKAKFRFGVKVNVNVMCGVAFKTSEFVGLAKLTGVLFNKLESILSNVFYMIPVCSNSTFNNPSKLRTIYKSYLRSLKLFPFIKLLFPFLSSMY